MVKESVSRTHIVPGAQHGSKTHVAPARRHDAVRAAGSAHVLCERLGIRFIEVTNEREAANYLAQLL